MWVFWFLDWAFELGQRWEWLGEDEGFRDVKDKVDEDEDGGLIRTQQKKSLDLD